MSAPSIAEELESCIQDCMVTDGSLAERLVKMADEIRRLAPRFAQMVDALVTRLETVDAGASAPRIGEPMPEFVLPDENGHLVSLAQLLRKGTVVIAFHRGHWCPYCRISADALAKFEPEITALGGQLVAITPEPEKYSRQLKARSGAAFPFLTDLDNGYALELQLAITINQYNPEVPQGGGTAPIVGNGNWILPIPATFVVGQDGLIKGRFVDPDFRRRMDFDDLLAALKA